jgi:hypothetical protein
VKPKYNAKFTRRLGNPLTLFRRNILEATASFVSLSHHQREGKDVKAVKNENKTLRIW